MDRKPSFSFKRFDIADDRSGMKLGTDAVLLGAWADCSHCRQVLDVGAGTGILSLMIAQRQPECHVTAVEIDPGAGEDARGNIEASPFAERISLIINNTHNYIPEDKPDLIISNPPYFDSGMEAPEAARAAARHGHELNFRSLAEYAAAHLAPEGSIALVAPYEQLDDIIYSLEINRLKLRRECAVEAVEGRRPVRVLLQASRLDGHLERSTLAIRRPDGAYTDEFKALTADFYLHF